MTTLVNLLTSYKNTQFTSVLIVCFATLFSISGSNGNLLLAVHIVTILLLAVAFLYVVNGYKKLEFPPYFYILFIANVIVFFSLFWSRNVYNSSFFNLTLHEATAFHLLAFNIKGELRVKLKYLIYLPVILLFLLYLWVLLLTPDLNNIIRFFMVESTFGIPKQFGGVASLVAIIAIYNYLKESNKLNLLIIIFGLAIIVLSESRTSFLATVIPFILFFKDLMGRRIYKTLPLLLVLLLVVYFIYQGRSLFVSRPYFYQSLEGLADFPIGIGMGNFAVMSTRYSLGIDNYWDYTIYAHNYFLEFLSGVGVLALVFYLWFLSFIKRLGHSQNKLIPSLVVAVTIIFFFDYTYAFPGMVWLWFILLGMLAGERTLQSISRKVTMK